MCSCSVDREVRAEQLLPGGDRLALARQALGDGERRQGLLRLGDKRVALASRDTSGDVVLVVGRVDDPDRVAERRRGGAVERDASREVAGDEQEETAKP